MYEINPKRTFHETTYKSKNKFGQTMILRIGKDPEWVGINFIYYVCFYITTKRKHGFQEGIQTGKDGLGSLLWAKKCIIDWIEYERNSYHTPKNIELCIYASDRRRFEAYKYGLIPLGFKVSYTRDPYLYLNLMDYKQPQ